MDSSLTEYWIQWTENNNVLYCTCIDCFELLEWLVSSTHNTEKIQSKSCPMKKYITFAIVMKIYKSNESTNSNKKLNHNFLMSSFFSLVPSLSFKGLCFSSLFFAFHFLILISNKTKKFLHQINRSRFGFIWHIVDCIEQWLHKVSNDHREHWTPCSGMKIIQWKFVVVNGIQYNL